MQLGVFIHESFMHERLSCQNCNANVLLQVPIMLRSDYCSLHDQDDMQLSDLGECPYDQVCNSAISFASGFTLLSGL